MGKHRKQREAGKSGRIAMTMAAIGFGVLQLGGVATAAAPAAPASKAATTGTPTTPSKSSPAKAPAAKVGGTPCTDVRIKACVDLSDNTTWLLDGQGHVVRGPVRNTHGAKGHETPTGHFVVQWKDRHHRSREYRNAEMPYSVFFDHSGRAFHQGSLSRQSSGCVRLQQKDAKAFYEHLQPNDRVQIVR